jgi:hypothetical protein
MAIKCCYGCVPPKRNPYCHSTCQEYIAEKAEHEKIKAKHDRENDITGAIMADRSNKVYNALKGLRVKKF